uniref:C-type lectin domain-containing protein n=1 Tax=Glossina brevipalpis TaxID=37001 RepID=A0A1A9W709_9MUSC
MNHCLYGPFCFILICVNGLNFALCNNFSTITEDEKTNSQNESSLHSSMLWSQCLEDYVLSQSFNQRYPKGLYYVANMNPPSVTQSTYLRPPTATINKRIGQASIELEPHKRSPLQIVNPQLRPVTYQMVQNSHQPGFFQQLLGVDQTTQQIRPPESMPIQQRPGLQPIRTVSENDLYLLGAIEKLVYRVDYLESRIRRTEQLIYYLMSGNNQKEVRDPCPSNFTRISDNCYYINSYQRVNWKSANSACKALNSHLVEFEKGSENEDVMAYLLNQPQHRGRDYWLGALNPGLLWIWSNSAKPVNPHTNLTSIAMAHQDSAGFGNDIAANSIDIDEKTEEKPSNATTTTNESFDNNDDIKGHGRCLRLTYNSSKHTYYYYGNECTSRYNYICEYEDKTLDNKIKKIARELKLWL